MEPNSDRRKRERHTLSDTFVKSIPPAEHGTTEYWSEEFTRLLLRVGKRSKTWQLVYHNAENKKCRLNIGKWPQTKYAAAVKVATQKLEEIDRGIDPRALQLEAIQAPTFEELAAEYMAKHSIPNKRSTRDDASMLHHDLLPAWGGIKARDITPRHVVSLLDKIVDRGSPIRANRTHSLISKIFKFGCGRQIVEHNPARDVTKPSKERPRDRVLNEDEIKRVWTAAEAQSPKIAAIFKLGMLTGQRKGEIAGLRWDEIAEEDGLAWWIIPAERSKNKRAHRVPLAPQALAIIGARREASDADPVYVFRARGPHQAIDNLKKPTDEVRTDAHVDNFKFHDLRRTFATTIKSLGVDDHIVSALLNHTPSDITHRAYNLYKYANEKRAALVVWERKLSEIISGVKPSNVVEGAFAAA